MTVEKPKPKSSDNQSRWIYADRLASLEGLDNLDSAERLWPSDERGPDPMAWRIRQVLTHLKPQHADALEDKYFLLKSTAEMAKDRGVTERAVRGLLERARKNFLAAWADHADKYQEVPKGEL